MENITNIGEILTTIRYDREQIDTVSLFQYVSYLSQNEALGTKGMKQLTDMCTQETDAFSNLNKIIDRNKTMKNAIKNYVLNCAKTVIEEAKKEMAIYIDPFYENAFYQAYHSLNNILNHPKETARIYWQTKQLEHLIQQNRDRKQKIEEALFCAQARLNTVIQMSYSFQNINQLADLLTALLDAYETYDYKQMQLETIQANTKFMQITRTNFETNTTSLQELLISYHDDYAIDSYQKHI